MTALRERNRLVTHKVDIGPRRINKMDRHSHLRNQDQSGNPI